MWRQTFTYLNIGDLRHSSHSLFFTHAACCLGADSSSSCPQLLFRTGWANGLHVCGHLSPMPVEHIAALSLSSWHLNTHPQSNTLDWSKLAPNLFLDPQLISLWPRLTPKLCVWIYGSPSLPRLFKYLSFNMSKQNPRFYRYTCFSSVFLTPIIQLVTDACTSLLLESFLYCYIYT